MTRLTNREAALHLCNGGKLEMWDSEEWGEGAGGQIDLRPNVIDKPSPYRAAVETFQITVRGEAFEVPEPVREPLEKGTLYWVPAPDTEKYAASFEWDNYKIEYKRLERGLIHLTEAAAVTHGKALCGVK